MAVGNTGNLFQHYIGLAAAERLQQVAGAFEYVDPFAMAPWEPLERPDTEFRKLLDAVLAASSTTASRAFTAAFAHRYPDGRPKIAKGVEYPNTSALLVHAGLKPKQVQFAELSPEKRTKLAEFLTLNEIPHAAHGDWATAPFSPCPDATLVMLDPHRVDTVARSSVGGKVTLTIDHMRGLLGEHRLGVLSRPQSSGGPPCIVTVFSFGQEATAGEAVDRALRDELAGRRGWLVHSVRDAMEIKSGKKKEGWHRAWWCASHRSVEPANPLQEEWDRLRDATA